MVNPVVQVHELYDGSVQIEFDRRKHKYRLLPERKLLFSATKINKILSKPMLIPWAARMAVEHVEEFVNATNPLNWAEEMPRILSEAKSASSNYSQERQRIGSMAHSWIEEFIHFKMGERKTPKAIPKIEGAKMACQAFMDWEAGHDIEWLWAERVVYSKKHGYVGTADAAANIDEEGPYLIDFKTGSGVFFEAGIQTALYASALREEFPVEWAHPLRRIIHASSINGKHHDHEEDLITSKLTGGTLDEDVEAGLHALALTHWINKGPSAWVFEKRW